MNGLLTQIRKSVRLRTRLQTVQESAQEKLRALRDKQQLEESHRRVEGAYVDPRISYPSYKSLDDYIDVDRLKRLDGYLRERLERRTADGKFWTGPYTLNLLDDRLPGSRMIELSTNKSKSEVDYFDLDKAELWKPSEHASQFAEVMDFIRTLPFKATGRILIMYDFSGRRVTAHRDHDRSDVSHEFIWFRTNLTKPFYVMNKQTGQRQYVESYSAWFDTVNQFHGADAAPGFSISLRVDGTFSDDLRARIPVPSENVASTAALWASIGDRRDRH